MSEGLGEWDPRVLPNRLKELIDEIIYSVAVQDNSKAIRAITDMFSDVRNPKLICIDSGIKKVEKKVKGSFGERARQTKNNQRMYCPRQRLLFHGHRLRW